jgi:hypothetical protein
LLTKKVLASKLLEEEASELADAYRARKTEVVTTALKDRQEIFKKNEENSA